ncbi:MAG: hypothetical protein IPG87_12490 [Saprospiraceae bacterium]|nr:hypothetical protein [Candidatus Vicinibacter affinis]
MNRVLSYKEGASFFEGNSSWEDRVTQGEGEAYGMEFFVQKKKANSMDGLDTLCPGIIGSLMK